MTNTPKIFSARTAQRLFREENMELALCHPNMIEAASKLFEQEGDHAAAIDIHARYEDYQEELRCMAAEFL
jgi:hypothetical protein